MTDQATICLMKPHHVPQVAEMDLYFSGPNDCYREADYYKMVSHNKATVPIIAHLNNRIIAFHIFCVQKHCVWGVRTFVHPDFRFRGIGQYLMEYQHHHYKKRHAYILKDGVESTDVFISKQDFLRRCGYHLDEVIHGDIQNPRQFVYARAASR